jgi:hypothetical protein
MPGVFSETEAVPLQSADCAKSLSTARHDNRWIQVCNQALQPTQARSLLCRSDRELAPVKGRQTKNGIC